MKDIVLQEYKMSCRQVITEFLSRMPSNASGADDGAVISRDNVRLQIRTIKDRYLIGEPIILLVTLQNMSKQQQNLAEPVFMYDILTAHVTPVTRGLKIPECTPSVGPDIPKNFSYNFDSGMSRNNTIDLLSQFDTPLPAGRYAVRISYKSPNNVPGIWQGKLKSPPLQISIVQPEGNDIPAANAFIRARKAMHSSLTRSEAVMLFSMLENPELGGVFAGYAGYYKAFAVASHKNEALLVSMLTEYINKYADQPHYGMLAAKILGYTLLNNGNAATARTFFERLPNGYEKELCITHCDLKLKR